MPSFGGSQWKRSCIGAEPAAKRERGLAVARVNGSRRGQCRPAAGNSGLTSGLAPQEPGWVGRTHGLLEALEIGCFREGVAQGKEGTQRSLVPPVFSTPGSRAPASLPGLMEPVPLQNSRV